MEAVLSSHVEKDPFTLALIRFLSFRACERSLPLRERIERENEKMYYNSTVMGSIHQSGFILSFKMLI